MADSGVAQRMFAARQALETREGTRLSLEELGRRIAEAEQGRTEGPYAAGVVKRWIDGEAEPRSMETWRAIAAVLGVRLGWLANGELPVRDDGEGNTPAPRAADPSPVPVGDWSRYKREVPDTPPAKGRSGNRAKKPGRGGGAASAVA